MEKFHTKVFMDSGIEYLFEMNEDEFLKQVVDEEGKLRHSFIRLTTNKQTVSINPLHISSIESIQVNTSQKIGIL